MESATISGADSLPLDRDHSGMNKFWGEGDGAYRSVRDVIVGMVEGAVDSHGQSIFISLSSFSG